MLLRGHSTIGHDSSIDDSPSQGSPPNCASTFVLVFLSTPSPHVVEQAPSNQSFHLQSTKTEIFKPVTLDYITRTLIISIAPGRLLLKYIYLDILEHCNFPLLRTLHCIHRRHVLQILSCLWYQSFPHLHMT